MEEGDVEMTVRAKRDYNEYVAVENGRPGGRIGWTLRRLGGFEGASFMNVVGGAYVGAIMGIVTLAASVVVMQFFRSGKKGMVQSWVTTRTRSRAIEIVKACG